MVKKIKKIVLCAAILVAGLKSILTVQAANTASTDVTVTGDIIKELSLSVVEQLRFGSLVRGDFNTGEPSTQMTITVTDQSTGAFTVAYSGNGSPDQSSTGSGVGSISAAGNRSIISPAKLTVTGESNFSYAISTSNSGYVAGLPLGGVTMRVNSFPGTRQLDALGDDTFYMGGLFTVSSGATLGLYTGTVDVTVTYD